MRRTIQVTVAGSVVGLAMLTGSVLLARDESEAWSHDWWSGVLVETGAAVLFLVPLYLITRSLDQHIEAVRDETAASVDKVREEAASSVQEIRVETETSVQELSDRVSSFEGDVVRRLDEIANSVNARLSKEREREKALLETVRQAPTREAVLDLINSAFSRGLITDRRLPRVPATTDPWRLYVAVGIDGDEESDENDSPYLQVESFDGTRIEEVPWTESDSVADVMVKVAHVVDTATGLPIDVNGIFTGLSDLLEVAASAPERRPIVQLCPPLWAVTTRSVVTYGRRRPPYGLTHVQLLSPRIHLDMAAKTWSNEDSFELAQNVALQLFRPSDPDEAPF